MKSWQAHLAVFAANLIYGANYSIAKLVTPIYIKPFGFIVLRVWVTAFLFWVAGSLFPYEKIKKKDWGRLILCAAFGVSINQMMFFKGLSLTSPINAGLMMISNPIFVLLIAWVLLKETISLKHITGIVLGISGCVALILYGAKGVDVKSSPLGDLFILINSFSYAIYLVIVKPIMKDYHPVTIMKWVFLIGSIIVLPFGYTEFKEVQWSDFNAELWWATGFVVIGTTFFAYLFNTLGLISLSSGVVSIYIYLQPLLAAGFAVLFGKDSLHWIHFTCAALIFSGVYLSTTRPSTEKS